MPHPLELLLDPLSLGVLALYALLLAWEARRPARRLPAVPGWRARALGSFVLYFYLSSYLPLLWDEALVEYRIVDATRLGPVGGLFAGLLAYNLLAYGYHRLLHKSQWLFRGVHQMHHSAERIDAVGAFFFSPLGIAGWTLVGSVSLALVGISAEANTLFLFATMFMAIFQHMNVRTPRWIGFFVQRPESHTLHHGRGHHRQNYCDLPVIDMLFGTFENPRDFEMETGFYNGASSRIAEMLLLKDVSRPVGSERTSSRPVPSLSELN